MLSTRPFECPPALLDRARRNPAVRTAVANAGAALALESAKQAAEEKLIDPILVGDRDNIARTADEIAWDISGYEIHHADDEDAEPRSTKSVISTIVIMNLVFSFDSILSAKALTDKFWLMALAIIIGGVMMIALAERVSAFLQRNRVYEVLGLFILFIVGIMLLSEGGHGAEMHLFEQKITKMSKATFYFVITVLVLTDIVQSRYQKKLLKQRRSQTK